MEQAMDNWENKFKEKIEGFNYVGEPSQEKVSRFFDLLDEDDQPDRKPLKIWYSIAASVALLIVSGLVVYQLNEKTIETSLGEFQEIDLPDGSTVKLFPESEIQYNQLAIRITKKRTVKLRGRGNFKVTKGEGFVVKSKRGNTRVRGTEFNINATDTSYEVECFSGKVEVEAGNSKVELIKGDATKLAGNELKKFGFDPKTPTWDRGEIHFDNKPIMEVIKLLESTYAIQVNNKDLIHSVKYSGFIPTDDVDLAIRLVFGPTGLDAKLKDDEVLLTPLD